MTPPPLLSHLEDLLQYSLDRTAAFPKSHRFTFGQRIDSRTLDALELCIKATYTRTPAKLEALAALNISLEQLRVLWRIIHARSWISRQQLFHISERIDSAGRMAGAWIKSLERR